MVGDQRHHLVAGHDGLDVARLRLGERAGAAVGLRQRVGVGARAAPQAAVVAVGVDAVLDQAGRRRAVAGGRVVGQAAVLAPVLAAGRRAGDEVGGVVDALVAPAALAGELPGGAGGLEAVGVDDRHDDVARVLHDRRRARVALLVAVDQLERPLHRELAGRPLAGVVDAHVEERRLAVVAVDVLGDLDAEHVLAAVGLLRQREELHEARVLGREVLELGVVVGQRAVAGAPARQRRGARADAARGGGAAARGHRGAALAQPRGPVLGDEVVHLDGPAQAGLAQRRLVLGAVQHDAEALLAAVLGHVEPEVGEALLLLAGRGDHVDQLRRGGLRRLGRAGRDRRVRERRRHGGGVAGAPARLDVDGAALQREAARDLLGVGRGVGGEHVPGRVEHRDVPVALAPVQAHLERAGPGELDVARGHPGAPGAVGAMARARVLARRARSAARRGRSWRRAAASARLARSPGRRGRRSGRG